MLKKYLNDRISNEEKSMKYIEKNKIPIQMTIRTDDEVFLKKVYQKA